MNLFAGIYAITVHRDGKPSMYYIGQAKAFGRRRREHFSSLRRKLHFNDRLQKAFNKYGESKVIFSPLLVCPPNAELLALYEEIV